MNSVVLDRIKRFIADETNETFFINTPSKIFKFTGGAFEYLDIVEDQHHTYLDIEYKYLMNNGLYGKVSYSILLNSIESVGSAD